MTFIDRLALSFFFVQIFTKVTYDEANTTYKWLAAAVIASAWHWLNEWLA